MTNEQEREPRCVFNIRPDGTIQILGREIPLSFEEQTAMAFVHRQLNPAWPPEAPHDR